MTDFASNSSQIQTKLLAKKYFELHPSAQKIIQLFALIYAPIDKNSFLSCISKTGALDENNRPWGTLLKVIVHKPVSDRPARTEPRVRNRRPKVYPLMTKPRHELRKQLQTA